MLLDAMDELAGHPRRDVRRIVRGLDRVMGRALTDEELSALCVEMVRLKRALSR
jgi:hypothetical protein